MPATTIRRDAREILPESEVFTYASGFGKGSPSAFSNYFRYKLLLDHVPPDAIYPIDWWNAHELITKPLPALPGSYAIHLWNEVWRHHGIDKDAAFDPAYGYETLKRRFGLSR